MKKHNWLSTVIVVSVLLIMNGSHVWAKSAPVYSNTLKLVLFSTPTTLDPQKTSLTINYSLSNHFFDPLFTLQDGEVVLTLLESYRWEAPTRWSFTLKKGVLFHDGSELTSRDVVASLNRLSRLKYKLYDKVKNYKIRALDDYNFELESQQPDSELLWSLRNIMIINHTAEQVDSEGFNSGEYLIGTGPYRLVERKGFKEFRLEAFPNYHRGAAFIQQLVIQAEPDSEKRMVDFLGGKVDMIQMSYTDAKRLSGLQGKANVINKASPYLYQLVLNVHQEKTPDVRRFDGEPLSHNPFRDLRVRQAISHALDREQLVFKLLGVKNSAQVAGQLVNENSESHDPALLPDKQNISKAKRLLKEAGYPKGFQVTIRDVEARRSYLEAIASNLAVIGIKADVDALPADEYFKGVRSGAFSAMFYAVSTDGGLQEMLKGNLYTNSSGNSGGYSNPILDQQIDDAASQVSMDLRNRKLREAQRTTIADLGVIPILFLPANWLIRPDMIFLPEDKLLTEAYYVRPNK